MASIHLLIVRFIKPKMQGLKFRIRRIWFYYFFKTFDIKIGEDVIIKGGKGSHVFGKNFTVLDRCIFESYEETGIFTVGDNCIFSYGVLCSITTKITIGNHVWIGEYSSIRNSTHLFSIHLPVGTINDKWEDIIIGNNVWVGRGTLILPGTIIGDNVTIAANSVVKGTIKSNALFGGSPAKFIKDLN